MSEDYKALYEAELKKNKDFAMRVARLEEENESLTFRLDRIHNNPLWRHTKKLRSGWRKRLFGQGCI